MAKFTTSKAQDCGITLGGIGTGSVELFPDGEFHQWQIANPDSWAFSLNGKPNASDGEEHTGALSFWVRTQAEGETPVVRKLGMKTDERDFRYSMFAWNKPVEAIEFDGKFPVAELRYIDRALPVEVSMKAISPFVPHNLRDSATPGFYLDFELSNPTDQPVTVSLLSLLRPTFCNEGGCVNQLYTDGDTTGIFLTPAPAASADDESKPNRGTLCFSAEGGNVSYITAEHTVYSRFYYSYSKLGVLEESFLHRFRKNGVLPDTTVGTPPVRSSTPVSDMSEQDIDAYIEELMQYPFARSFRDRVRHLNPSFPADRKGKEDLLAACNHALAKMGSSFGVCALCNQATLGAHETKQVRFILSWFFPNHIGKFGNKLGHQYENLFADAREVNRYLARSRAHIADKALAFADILYNTSLPTFYPDAWSGQLSTLVKDSWYLKNGKFGLWEGFSSCGFHTTDITYQASFGLLALFPQLQLGQMEMGAAFQREDGRIPHFFTPDLDHVDNGFDRVDMNNQFVLLVCRDYLYTGDRAYLERMWCPVQKAMDSIERLDTDGDGLPDEGTTRNTYDAWNFSGTPAYISILWLSALKAAVKIASVMGDDRRRDQWQALLERGLASLEARLWNGTYYDLWCRDSENGPVVDGSLMTDQASGEWFLRMAGIGGNLADGRVRGLMETIFAQNYDPHYGLVNATCPEGRPISLDTFENCQATTIWTGIGYTIAALALSLGLETVSHTLMESTHENQLRCGRLWNHEECGPRYTRPLSSWTTLIAAVGLEVDASQKRLRLTPCREEITAPFCTCDHVGSIRCSSGDCVITLAEGTLDGWDVQAIYGDTPLRIIIQTI